MPRICSFWHSRDSSPVLVPSLAALGTACPAVGAQGWEGAELPGQMWLPKSQARWVPSQGDTSIAGGVSVPKCPVQHVPGHSWVFPLDGDKRLQLLSLVGARGVTLASQNTPP